MALRTKDADRRLPGRCWRNGRVPSLAAAQGAASPDEARKRLEADKSRLDATQKRSKEIKADLDKIAAERQRINARLVETGKLIHQSEGQLNLIEFAAGRAGGAGKAAAGTLEQRHGAISALLAAMQRMGRNPPPVMITRREDALSMVRSAMLLAAAFPELRGQALALAEQLNDLARVMSEHPHRGREAARPRRRGSTRRARGWRRCRRRSGSRCRSARPNSTACATRPPRSPRTWRS